jgi:hypothetical protein
MFQEFENGWPDLVRITNASFKAFTAVILKVIVFWAVMLCSVVAGYQYFSCYTSIFILQKEAPETSETVSCHNST